jgi:fatty acid desaturase
MSNQESLSEAFSAIDVPPGREYAELKRQLKSKGLLDRQPAYYTRRIALLFGLLVVGVVVLLLVKVFWLQLLNAAYLAFVFTQIGLLSHEAGHRQMFHRAWKHDLLGLVGGNFLLGMSYAWWLDKHNTHHSYPNQIGMDPDIEIPFLTLTGIEDLEQPGKLKQFCMKYQAFLFFPGLMAVAVGLQCSSVSFLVRKRAKYQALEWFLIVAHFGVSLTLVFFCLGFWHAILFVAIHQALTGLYLGSIFAPNHKGMPILKKESDLDFLQRQVQTSRNVYAHPLTDFWYGGLNYQIEHHLFPSMARNKLKEAQAIVRTFCQAHAIPYHETTALQSFAEILSYLHGIGAPLRRVSFSYSGPPKA